jgi:hypothetical protein
MLQLEENEKLYLSLSEKALERSRLFSWEKTALGLRRFYEEVLGKADL